jgi:hypothetical protein
LQDITVNLGTSSADPSATEASFFAEPSGPSWLGLAAGQLP